MKMEASALIIGMIAGTFGLSGGAGVHEISGALIVVATTVGMVGAAFDFAITRRFAFSTAYRVSGATVSEVPILHFFMIGSRFTL